MSWWQVASSIVQLLHRVLAGQTTARVVTADARVGFLRRVIIHRAQDMLTAFAAEVIHDRFQ